MKIKIAKEDLINASKSDIIKDEQVDPLWTFFNVINQNNPYFTGLNVTYYFGALIIISSMTWLATEAFATFSSLGLMTISVFYFFIFLTIGNKLYQKPITYIPGGLLLTVAVFMIPLLIFSVQNYFKIWVFKIPGNYRDYYEWIKSGWFFMEIGTILISSIFIYFFHFPFLSFPLAFTLWFLSMDLTPIVFGTPHFSLDQRKIVSIVFGLIILISTYFLDRRTKKDYAFWLYLFGLLSFWCGLSLLRSTSELSKFSYFCINISLIIIAVLFSRKIFIVFGSIGSYIYLYHLSNKIFKDSIIFPIVLSMIGLLIIWLGIKYNKNKEIIDNYINSVFPKKLLRFLPPNR